MNQGKLKLNEYQTGTHLYKSNSGTHIPDLGFTHNLMDSKKLGKPTVSDSAIQQNIIVT